MDSARGRRPLEKTLGKMGFNVKIIWDHDYDEKMKKDLESRNFCDRLLILEAIRPRDAFYSSRTNAINWISTYRKHIDEEI